MAKKRKNLKRKHNQDNLQSEFLADMPESEDPSEWSPSMDMHNSPQATEVPSLKESHHQDPIEEVPQHEKLENISQNEAIQESDTLNETQDGVTLGNTIGPYLKKEREKRGIQLNFVAQSTKIGLTNLENLEVDRLEGLPNKAYVTGYVKSYSKLLNLNTIEALKLLDYTYQKLGNAQGPQKIVIPQTPNSSKMSMPRPSIKIGIIVGGLLFLIAIAILSYPFFTHSVKNKVQTSSIQRETQNKTQEAPKDITPQSLSAKTPLQEELSNATPMIKEVQANNEEPDSTSPETASKEMKEEKKEAGPEQAKAAKEEALKKEETKDQKMKFYGMSTHLYQYDNEMTQKKINELLPSRFRVTPTKGILAVYITATKGDSWLTYKSDNDSIRKFVLKEDRSILIRAKVTRLFLGNVRAVKVFLDNRPLRINSASGVKSLVFPQEMSGDYVTPLFIYKKNGSVITSEEYLINQGHQ